MSKIRRGGANKNRNGKREAFWRGVLKRHVRCVGAATVVVRQTVHRAHVGRDGVLRIVAQVHLFDHALSEGRHRWCSQRWQAIVAGGCSLLPACAAQRRGAS